MVDSPVQASSEAAGAHLVLYDGVCGLCSRLVQFLLAHDHRAVFNFAVAPERNRPGDGRTLRRRPSRTDIVLRRRELSNTGRLAASRGATPRFLWRESSGGRGRRRGSYASFPRAFLDRAYDVVARIGIASSAGTNNAGCRLRNSENGSWIEWEGVMKIVIPGDLDKSGRYLPARFTTKATTSSCLSRGPTSGCPVEHDAGRLM